MSIDNVLNYFEEEVERKPLKEKKKITKPPIYVYEDLETQIKEVKKKEKYLKEITEKVERKNKYLTKVCENLKKSEKLRIKINKGVKEGLGDRELLVYAIECISLMASEPLFLKQNLENLKKQDLRKCPKNVAKMS